MQRSRTRNISNANQTARYKELEFKFLYFKLQRLINHKIQITLKYDQLKQPEINLTMIKPIALKVIELANNNSLSTKIRGGGSGTTDFRSMIENKISIMTVYILMLLRYEYLIQSQNNLIIHDLLITKANVCELLSIRVLREFKAVSRVKLLFINPLKQFNTLELCILTKSKKFLSQPIMIQTLDKFYNGSLIIQDSGKVEDEETSLLQENITNYKYQKVTLTKINTRSVIVPKYQSLVINLKNLAFTFIHIIIILNQHQNVVPNNFLELIFYVCGMNLTYEFCIKIYYINRKFLKKILWFYLDFTLIVLININLLLKILCMTNKIEETFYYQIFSLFSILLFPRNLSIFNNYKFFNLIILGFKKMIWNMAGMFCLFLTLIVGFYISFISLNLHRSNFEIAFDLLQIFFGFTPAVWTNWNTYSPVGKIIQISYLFLSQFIISTILAIVLSEVFSEVSSNIQEDFQYFKAVNLVIYFKSSRIFTDKLGVVIKFPILLTIFVYELCISKFFNTEKEKERNFTFLDKERDYYGDMELSNMDYINDESDLSLLIKSRKSSAATHLQHNIFNPITPSGVTLGRNYSHVDHANSQFASSSQFAPGTPTAGPGPLASNPFTPAPGSNFTAANLAANNNNNTETPALVPFKSISTLGNFKSASTDSLFIDDLLSKKYGMASVSVNKRGKGKDIDTNIILDKLSKLEDKLDKLERYEEKYDDTNIQSINQSILDDVDNNSVNLYNIRETSFDGTSIDSEDAFGLDEGSISSDDTF